MKNSSGKIYGGIEAGGTKFLCAVGTGPADLLLKRIETATPQKTIDEVVRFFQPYTARKAGGRLVAAGIASFGPLELKKESPRYGYITTTPKPGWTNVNLAGRIKDALGVPVAIDTDVNGAALGEQEWGAARGLSTFIYVTIGTGIGGGGVINGELMHGLAHPEMGHIRIPRADKENRGFNGSCRFHGDCWEGLASGASMQQRWGKAPEEILKSDTVYHRAWDLEASYIATGICNLICPLSPQRVILGGGIMNHPGLLEAVQQKVGQLLNKYIPALDSPGKIRNYIVRPALKSARTGAFLSGVLGAIVLAKQTGR
ncbi:MAG: fructokinase [Chloroflexi bacterium RBG_13_57_8]|nr:MAG: fructokinase [Chloroflexi bacterium RBG_13_57_8]